MDLEHVRSLIEQGLFFGVTLRLFRGETEIGKRRLGLAAGWGVGQVAFRSLRRGGQREIQGLRRSGSHRDLGDARAEARGRGGHFIISRREHAYKVLAGGVSHGFRHGSGV